MMAEIQLDFRIAQPLVIGEQDGAIEAVLVAEIIIEHALASIGALGDAVHPRAG